MAFSREIADEILARISEGEYLRAICRSDPKFPSEALFRKWVLADTDGLGSQYARARELQFAAWEDKMMVCAEDGSADLKTIETRSGTIEVVDSEIVRRSEIRLQTMKWLMAKLHPKKYGDKVDATLTHEAGDSLLALLGRARNGDRG